MTHEIDIQKHYPHKYHLPQLHILDTMYVDRNLSPALMEVANERIRPKGRINLSMSYRNGENYCLFAQEFVFNHDECALITYPAHSSSESPVMAFGKTKAVPIALSSTLDHLIHTIQLTTLTKDEQDEYLSIYASHGPRIVRGAVVRAVSNEFHTLVMQFNARRNASLQQAGILTQ